MRVRLDEIDHFGIERLVAVDSGADADAVSELAPLPPFVGASSMSTEVARRLR